MQISGKIDYIQDLYYYEVDGYRTLNKNMALLLAGGKTGKIYFYNMEHIWDQQNWSTEPEKSIQTLCEERAKQLRHRYDWLCLWLTTGYDSQTILETCIRAGVKLDEIAYIHRPEYYKDPETPHAKIEIEKYKKYHNPNLKVLELTVGLDFHKRFYSGMKDEWMLTLPGQNLRFSKTTPIFLHYFHEDLLRRKEQTPARRADIYGYEKPRVDLRDGVWYAQSLDFLYRDFMGAGVGIESFYTSPDLPELHVKQFHLMINWLETIKGMSHDMVHEIQAFAIHEKSYEDLQNKDSSEIVSYYKDWNIALGRTLAKSFAGAHGLNKFPFSQELTAKDALKMLKHLFDTDDKVLNYAHKTRIELSNACNNITNFSVPIFGKSWAMRPYIDRSKETPKILV